MSSLDNPGTLPVSLDDIKQAHQRIKNAIIRTPTLYSRTLSDLIGAGVWLKFENFQFTAAYKERGALNKLLSLDKVAREEGYCRFGRKSCPRSRLSRESFGYSGHDRDACPYPRR